MVSRDREVGEEQGAEMGKVRSKGGCMACCVGSGPWEGAAEPRQGPEGDMAAAPREPPVVTQSPVLKGCDPTERCLPDGAARRALLCFFLPLH